MEDANLFALQQFLVKPPCAVIYALCDAVDGSEAQETVDDLAPLLYKLFLAHNREVELLNTLLSREVATTLDSCTLLRRNSLATKVLAHFLKDVGKDYLVKVLRQPLEFVVQFKNGFELDPNRMEKDEDACENAMNLQTITQQFMSAVLDTLDELPPQLRHVCQHLHENVSKHFPGSEVASIGSLLFLRYTCPAIVAPEVAGVITPKDVKLSKRDRRCLILVSKVIQNIANGIVSFKEENMKALDHYLVSSVSRVDNYLLAVSVYTYVLFPCHVIVDTVMGILDIS